MNMYIINEMIEDLEKSETTFENCQELANLYIIRDHLKVKPSLLLNESELLTKELSDIFPQYGKYVESKKEYQLNDAPKESVIKNMKLLCKEVGEFISLLYCNSDMPEERSIIQNTINSLKIKNGG